VNYPGAIGVQATEPAKTQMIVMRAQDHGLIPEHRVPAGQNADHVLAGRSGCWGLPDCGRVSPDRKGLKPASRSGLKSDFGKPPRQVGGGRIGSGRAGHPALEPVIAEKLNVVEQTGRLSDPLSLKTTTQGH
jgi:hypothetical protein